ncbi:hypothetical protein AB0L80_17340 [Streptomyces sp. NPDC052069]|uniref:hypothetical protein n=1 Tax=Streptomyces sp. NPDC052069 TaxID=3154650 RepID=UPI003418EABD
MRVTNEDLRGEAPVALRDSRTNYELAIDFSYPPEQIAAALTDVFQEAVNSRRWSRHANGEHGQADDEPPAGYAARHPEDGY